MSEIYDLKRENDLLRKQVDWLLAQLKLSKKRRFGASSEKSEYDLDRLNLFDGAETAADMKVREPELVEIKKHYRNRTHLLTDKVPDDLPVEAIRHELPESEQICPDCGEKLRVIGHETREEAVLIPAG
ncbi:MAG: hypothetical protein LBT44_01080 [Clostridiales bacterium]|nr:hypothetical protein [Clostridiales bacterium]